MAPVPGHRPWCRQGLWRSRPSRCRRSDAPADRWRRWPGQGPATRAGRPRDSGCSAAARIARASGAGCRRSRHPPARPGRRAAPNPAGPGRVLRRHGAGRRCPGGRRPVGQGGANRQRAAGAGPDAAAGAAAGRLPDARRAGGACASALVWPVRGKGPAGLPPAPAPGRDARRPGRARRRSLVVGSRPGRRRTGRPRPGPWRPARCRGGVPASPRLRRRPAAGRTWATGHGSAACPAAGQATGRPAARYPRGRMDRARRGG
ncbi:hypothetical protein D3C84_763860 [compost metagenome]